MIKRKVIVIAFLKQAKTPQEVKMIGISAVRNAYNDLASDYNKIIDYDWLFCHKCGEFLASTTFYNDSRFATGKFPICKRCVMEMVEQRKKKTDPPNETKESVQEVLRLMDLPYIDSFYEDCIKGAWDEAKEKNRNSPFSTYNTAIRSLPQYRGLKWKDSDFGDSLYADLDNIEETKKNEKIIKKGRKRFGNYPNEDLLFLENEYEDWISRYECNTKAQESIFERLSFKKWEINKATKSGQPTKDLDKTYQELLSTANITPRQTGMDAFADAQTLGTLIQKYEETRPLPEVDEDLKDVDKIGLMIDAFFRGHTTKMLGIKNAFTHIYEKVMAKYTVTPPTYEDEEDSEAMFDKIFGKVDDY